MRDMRKELAFVGSESAMDYCEAFNEIKSVLEFCNKHVKPFNKLHFRSGNEPVIYEMVNRLQSVLEKHAYKQPHVEIEPKEPLIKDEVLMRKIVMFLVANTDATYKYNLRDDINFTHISEICPLMPKFLFMAIIWELELDKYFYEMLVAAPCWFTFQFFELASDSLKHIDDAFKVLEKLENILISLFKCVSRMAERRLDLVDCKVISNKLYDSTMSLLRQFYTPDAEKFKNFIREEQYRYSGFLLRHLLNLVLQIFDVFENTYDFKLEHKNLAVYQLCIDLCPFVNEQQNAKITAMIKEQQKRILLAVLNSLHYNVMLINIDPFMYWVEISITRNMTLQQVIRELAYYCCERMCINTELLHDLLTFLRVFAGKPKELHEKITEATLGDILISLDECLIETERQQWFDELLNRHMALINDECLQCISDNIAMLHLANCKKLIDFFKLQLLHDLHAELDTTTAETREILENQQLNVEEFEQLLQLIRYSLQNYNIAQINELLQYVLTHFGSGSYVFCANTIEFPKRLNKFLLKHNTIDNFDLLGFLKICFENPQMVWQQFFKCATEMPVRLELFCHVVEKSKNLADFFVPELLVDTITNNQKLQQSLTIELLYKIYFILYHTTRQKDFLDDYLNKYMTQMLDAGNFTGLLALMHLSNKIAKHGETQTHKPLNFNEFTCPMLLTVAGILEKARWYQLTTYSEERYQLVCVCIEFIQYTNKIFLPSASERDRLFVSKYVKETYSEIVQYYFQKYALPPQEKPKVFDEFIVPKDVATDEELRLWLLKNIIRCTQKETEWLAKSERFSPTFSESMIMLAIVVEDVTRDTPSQVLENYRRCFENFGFAVKKLLLPKVKDNAEKLEKLLFQVLKNIAAIPSVIFAETFLSMLWLPLEIVENCMQEINFELYKRILTFVGKFAECNAKKIFCEKLESVIRK